MKILTTDDKKNEAYLRTAVPPMDIKQEDLEEIRRSVRDMRACMLAAPGVGLSANQVGISKRFFVAQVPDPDGRDTFYAVLNPEITKSSGAVSAEEGCLSIPHVFGNVSRSEKVTLEGVSPTGKKVKIKAKGLLARVFQHEIDHLDGVLFIDKATSLHRVPPEGGISKS